MLRRALLLAAMALASLSAPPVAAQPLRVTDLAGREVVLERPARRLLLGEGRFIHAIALLERENPAAVVAGWMADFQRLDPNGYAQYRARFPELDRIPLLGTTTAESFSVERALALQPDLVVLGLGSGHAPGRGNAVVDQLARAGVPVLFIDFRNHPLADTGPSLRALGQALGRSREAEEYLAFHQAHLDRIRARLEEAKPARPTVLMEMRAGGSRPCCGSPGNGNLGELVEFAGGHNLGADRIPGVLGQLNLEFVVASDPVVYVATGGTNSDGTSPVVGAGITPEAAQAALEGTVQRAGISSLTAVRTGRAHALWHNFYNSPYNLLAVEALARWIHPEIFTDLDPAATLAEMNSRFLAVPLEGTFWISLR